ncbi:MAG TPA: DNA translocase FtsK 4TM domain-containing protein [Stellaceae bacterium]|nr:DNA translocase FtsK 4TM domain-containing protein [Stellaceae bacterium]
MGNWTANLDAKTLDGKRRAWPPTQSFFRRRLSEAGGSVLFLAALLLAVALVTYDHEDPSWNHAVDAPTHNWVGPYGATISDVLCQSLGAAPLVLPIVLFAWSFRLLLYRGIPALWLRLALLPLTTVAAAAALALIPGQSGWLARGEFGGTLGKMLLGFIADTTHLSLPIIAMAAAALVGLALLYILGLSWHDWREIGQGAGRVAAASGRGSVVVAGHGARIAGRLQAMWRAIEWRRREDSADSAKKRPGERCEPLLGVQETRPGRAKRSEGPEDDIVERTQPRALPPDLVAPKPAGAAPGRRATPVRQATLDLNPDDEHVLPPLDLLAAPPASKHTATINEEALQQNARLLETVLDDFGVKGQIVKVRPGPVVTLYELEPAPGIKASRIIGLADDIARSMSAVSVRVAVVPGRNVIGIELPNARAETVYLRELLASDAYERTSARLTLVLGKDIGGAPIIADLAKMPHLLIAGTTGSGKSVGINTMILSILYRMPPDQCKFIMVDPKMLELSIYDGIPHLLAPVVTDPRKAVMALKWAVREMENRYRNMSKLGVRNIEGYNGRLEEARNRGEVLMRRIQTGFNPETGQPIFEEQVLDLTPLPFIIVVVDEMADLMLVAGKDIEAAVQRLAQMARAAGIHIIMATQRPSVDVITGTIKANFPTRISFQVTSKIDSRTILGEGGAEQLLGRGDMLYMAGGGRITRVHGPFVGDKEVESIVAFLKSRGEPTCLDEVTEDEEAPLLAEDAGDGGESGDMLYDQAVALVCRERKASTSFVQRHLQIGYNRAARIIERMESEGVVSAANHVGKREVLARHVE